MCDDLYSYMDVSLELDGGFVVGLQTATQTQTKDAKRRGHNNMVKLYIPIGVFNGKVHGICVANIRVWDVTDLSCK